MSLIILSLIDLIDFYNLKRFITSLIMLSSIGKRLAIFILTDKKHFHYLLARRASENAPKTVSVILESLFFKCYFLSQQSISSCFIKST